MFALVADDALYLKADDNTSGAFVELGLQQFEYEKKGKVMRMSYYAAPEEIFDDREQAREWADQAYGAALRQESRSSSFAVSPENWPVLF
ncbi:TfoX/Sxy family protein [Marinobacter similis]|uniref:TfoX/Sxy family protein n=1 Tax=Marinobacter similis TaxID=1420916 RepID=UPI000ABA4966|nr:TfoX/Sxy family protein [Marinobacter similis]